MKIKMRLHLTFEKELYESSDGKNVPIRREAVLSNKQINTSTKHNMSNSIEEQMKDMARNIEVLEQQYAEGKLIRWCMPYRQSERQSIQTRHQFSKRSPPLKTKKTLYSPLTIIQSMHWKRGIQYVYSYTKYIQRPT